MQQWQALKAENPEALLFFRMGDFYELFFDDAVTASAALDITLTTRGHNADKPIAMCGVPAGAASAYLARLIRRGFRVAVAEQTETATRGRSPSGKPLTRSVVRVVTPGTLTEEELLEPGRANFLLALVQATPVQKRGKKGEHKEPHNQTIEYGAAWIDVSTGLFETMRVKQSALLAMLGRLDPAEILAEKEIVLPDYENRCAHFERSVTVDTARQKLASIFNVASLEAFGTFSDEECCAAMLAIEYIQRTQSGKLPRLTRPVTQTDARIMGMDAATRASLDILRARDGGDEHTLFAAVNRTVSASGGRQLAAWLAAPLTQKTLITQRQEAWCFLREEGSICKKLREVLKKTPDIMRSLGRLSIGRGQPRDLGAIKEGLHIARQAKSVLEEKPASLVPILQEISTTLEAAETLRVTLSAALATEIPLKFEEGGVIANGYDTELDGYRTLCTESKNLIAALQARYVAHYGIPSLKVRYHAQLGYIVEVSSTIGARLKENPELVLRQGTASSMRFSTEELAELDVRLTEAADKAIQRERVLFTQLVDSVLAANEVPLIAEALALLDVFQSCAALTHEGVWCCPQVTEDTAFSLTLCRHPIVEAALPSGTCFTPNGCNLAEERRVMLLTGPNMAGKSTFLRQTALAVILAQAGLPVAAEQAHIGVVDHLFSRVGASDDLARGRSTFMVEMTETAAILNQAGPRSLVVVDEIGRGTATLDGLAIARAVLEALHTTVRCRTIFATHFHELAQLVEILPCLSLHTMAVREWRGRVVFLHEVLAGAAKKSWGVYVARLAGVPVPVLERAENLLRDLERKGKTLPESLPLFAHQYTSSSVETNGETHEETEGEKLKKRLATLDLDSLTPRAALEMLYELQKEARNEATA
ncbi:MAG: DNA mismatch repair protein MutS [Acetobacter sp.]|nr:DNA mismatch repair protein MutS [Acetobacter sp.]